MKYIALRTDDGKNTIRKIMEKIGLIHKPRRKPNGITKADREARKSDDLIKRNFRVAKPLEKGVTDINFYFDKRRKRLPCQRYY